MISLSTHVLDVERGAPAAGVLVTLSRAEAVVASGATDADGRIARLAHALEPATYELSFDVAGYLTAQERPAPFVQRLSLRLAMHDDRHYHVPLLLSAYACTTYRGT
jgi:5-hydroxyisourate hydrolase